MDTPSDQLEPDPLDLDDGAADEEGAETAEQWWPPRYRQDLSVNYLGGLFLASIVMLAAGALGFLSWWLVIPSVFVLMSTLFAGWGKITMGGGLVVGVVVIASVVTVLSQGEEPDVETPTPTQPAAEPLPPVEGSLGIYVTQVSDLWNTVDGPPRIQKGLTHQTEPGELDAFIYRFGEWGRLIGAYNDDTEAVYGLLATGQLSGPATDQLYIHLCFVVAPYDPECIEAYQTRGLAGEELMSYVDAAHATTWDFGDHSWQLQIEENVLSLRVFGEDIP